LPTILEGSDVVRNTGLAIVLAASLFGGYPQAEKRHADIDG